MSPMSPGLDLCTQNEHQGSFIEYDSEKNEYFIFVALEYVTEEYPGETVCAFAAAQRTHAFRVFGCVSPMNTRSFGAMHWLYRRPD